MSDEETTLCEVDDLWCLSKMTKREAELAAAYINGMRAGERRGTVPAQAVREVDE